MAHPTSTDVLPAAARDTSLDTSRMWEVFAARLRAFVARRAPAGIDPDDVVQDVFVRVVRHLPTLRSTERLEAWLFQIARNALRDTMRARKRKDSRTDPLDMDVPAEAGDDGDRAAEAELAPCLAPMVASLPAAYRQAIELTSVEGLTQTEAARHAGVSVSGMKSRVQRGRTQLKDLLLACCAVGVDRRQRLSAYSVRNPAACAAPSTGAASTSSCGCRPCAPSGR